ncbi:hypothetical protein [Adhaeribacter terreus]|uniref:Lipoprotein n=1 Tax=Adhaeribacter terreus TaxID=529703 RepID=A0ABW0EEF3_9BACT
MKIKKIGFIVSFILSCLIGCKQSQVKKQPFDEFISQLNQVQFPYTYNSKKHLPISSLSSNTFDALHFNSGPTLYDHFGYFLSDSGTVHVLSMHSGDFFQSLTITTFDLKGNKLFEADLSSENCVGSPPIGFKSCDEIIKIDQNKTISNISTKIISGKKQQDSLLTTSYKMKLWNNGKLKKNNNI